MALPHGTTGSLSPAFAPARLVSLAVKLPSAFTLYARLPTALREPLSASVTFWEATAPVKLPTWHCLKAGFTALVRTPTTQGWYFKVGSTEASAPVSKPPTYPTHGWPESNTRLQ